MIIIGHNQLTGTWGSSLAAAGRRPQPQQIAVVQRTARASKGTQVQSIYKYKYILSTYKYKHKHKQQASNKTKNNLEFRKKKKKKKKKKRKKLILI